jgi:hypothetical protein
LRGGEVENEIHRGKIEGRSKTDQAAETQKGEAEMNAFSKVKIVMKLASLFLKGEISMKNWKTTVSGIIAAAGQILSLFGVPVEVGQAVSVIGLFLLGIFCKDSNVTGGTVSQ